MDLETRAQLANLLTQIDDQVLLQWALLEHGDVRSPRGHQILIERKRRDLGKLALAIGMTTPDVWTETRRG